MSKPRKCPICAKPANIAESPFCSARCREIDLHRWLNGDYAIPAEDQSANDHRGGDNDNHNQA